LYTAIENQHELVISTSDCLHSAFKNNLIKWLRTLDNCDI